VPINVSWLLNVFNSKSVDKPIVAVDKLLALSVEKFATPDVCISLQEKRSRPAVCINSVKLPLRINVDASVSSKLSLMLYTNAPIDDVFVLVELVSIVNISSVSNWSQLTIPDAVIPLLNDASSIQVMKEVFKVLVLVVCDVIVEKLALVGSGSPAEEIVFPTIVMFVPAISSS